MSSSILLINAAGRETRVALVENGHIAEFYLERKKDKGVVGNIYKGRVTRVLPGMQAAFVDIGLEKAAFLYVSDVFYDPEFSRYHFELTEGEHGETPEVPELPEGAEHGEEEGPDVVDAAPEPEAPDAAAALAPEDGGHHDAEFEMHEVAQPVPPSSAPTPAITAPEAAAPALAATEGLPPPPATDAGAIATVEAVPPQNLGAAVIEKVVQEAQAQTQDARALQRHKELKQRRREEKQRKPARIEELLKVGQEVVVQISKDPIGTKGARLTSHISIPGRHLVFMPTVDHIGISRRIGNEKERRRLRDTVERLRPPGSGFIVRTVAENVPQEKLEADIRFLIEVWNETLRKNEKIHHRPGLLHPDLDLILRATRDLFAADVEQLVIDDRDEYERVLQFVTAQDPALKDRVKLHDSEEPILDAYGVEEEIKRATQRKVWLKSGGYLIIDQAEALVAIDVNSGRYVGKKSLEETITKINVEAAKEIVYQLRLRNIGGIIICDFIDMEKQQNRDKVFKALQEALGRDKAKTNVLRISELGLVEMTRKRVRESIGRMLHEDCAVCEGQGFVKTATTVGYEIFREIRRSASSYKEPTVVVNCATDVANLLLGEEKAELRHLMDRFNKSIQVKAMTDYHREQYEIFIKPVTGNEFKVASSGEYAPVHIGNVKHRPPENSRDQRRDRRDRDRGERGDRGDRERGERGGGGGGGGGGGRGENREARGEGRDRDRDRNRNRDRNRDRGERGERQGERQNGERQAGERQNAERQNAGGGEPTPPQPSAPPPSEG